MVYKKQVHFPQKIGGDHAAFHYNQNYKTTYKTNKWLLSRAQIQYKKHKTHYYL